MKCLRWNLQFKFFLALVVPLVLSSCHQQTVEVLSSHESFFQGDSGKLVVTVANLGGGSQRTIAPNQLTGADLHNPNRYQFKLTGTSGRKTLPERTLTLSNGTTTLSDIPEGLWELTLQAINVAQSNGLPAGSVVLEGKATAQVGGTGVATASFVLTPPATGSGSLSVTINLHQQDVTMLNSSSNAIPQKRLIIELLNKENTRESVSAYNRSGASYNFPSQVSFPHTGANNTNIFPAGKYELRITLSMGNKAATASTGSYDPLPEAAVVTWFDEVYIEPGLLTTSTINLPRLINRAPAPTGVNSTGITTVQNGLYDVVLNWNPVSSYNSKGYEVELMAINTRITTDAAWDARTETKYKINGIPGDSNHFSKKINTYPVSVGDGLTSFNLTSRSLPLTLAAGSYTYRIRSLSDTGNSNWVYGGNILMPFPAAPTIPNNNNYLKSINNSGSTFNIVVGWNAVPFATSYQIQTIKFLSVPQDYERYRNDRAFESVSASDRGGVDPSDNNSTATQKTWNGLDQRNNYLIRVRAVNSSGASPWVYFPRLITKDGIRP